MAKVLPHLAPVFSNLEYLRLTWRLVTDGEPRVHLRLRDF